MQTLEIAPLLAGLGIAIVSGSLGCLVVWRNLAYFADSLAHSALLGVTIGIILGFSPYLLTVLVCVGFALLLILVERQKNLSTDGWLGVLSFSTMSIGLVVLSLVTGVALNDTHRTHPNSADAPLQQQPQIQLDVQPKIENEHGPADIPIHIGETQNEELAHLDLEFFLFGNILDIQWQNIVWIYLGGLLIMGLLVFYWPSLVLMSIDEELARAEGINTFRLHVLSMLMLALFIGFAVRLVGLFLVAALLILPAAAARQWSKSPTGMLVLASSLAVLAVLGSFMLSTFLPLPVGPTAIVLIASALMVGLLVSKK